VKDIAVNLVAKNLCNIICSSLMELTLCPCCQDGSQAGTVSACLKPQSTLVQKLL